MDTPSCEQILEEKNKELTACTEQYARMKKQFDYLASDFENYKRRMSSERVLFVRETRFTLLRETLAILDTFEKAMAQLEKDAAAQIHAEGMRLIHQTFIKFLQNNGVQKIDQITTFDPSLHEAVMQKHVDGVVSGSVIEVLEKGYTCDGELLRPAKVSVAA
ncbi:MAG: Protein GrpE [candidate division TM6 bacterium GW2011_GWE2_41_16]|nr:MAG: Protein GrpE [candidate division TM6 bacterium GW2011_GWE2_41_16]